MIVCDGYCVDGVGLDDGAVEDLAQVVRRARVTRLSKEERGWDQPSHERGRAQARRDAPP